jgi:hypothetical protein
MNALRCLHLLLTHTSHCQLTSDLIVLIQPLIHIPICESYVIEILPEKQLSLSNLCSCSSMTSLQSIFHHLTHYPNKQYTFDEENQLINRIIPDFICSYRNNEHDLSAFFSSSSPENTQVCAAILMQLCSFDSLPYQSGRQRKTVLARSEFDDIEIQWSQLKLLHSVNHEEEDTQLDFHLKANTCELNLTIFKRTIEIYAKNIRFIQQLKDKHLVRSILTPHRTRGRRPCALRLDL